jgi:hypothetical protein
LMNKNNALYDRLGKGKHRVNISNEISFLRGSLSGSQRVEPPMEKSSGSPLCCACKVSRREQEARRTNEYHQFLEDGERNGREWMRGDH